MASPPFYTPLRYPGGKGKLAPFVAAVVESNGLADGHYVEPFAGGAAIACELLRLEYVSHAHINDIDLSVYFFWRSVLLDTEELCQLIFDTPVTMDMWNAQKLVQNDKTNYPPLEVGFSTFFLNRTNRSGILKGGVIGGKQQDGKWKLDARYNKRDLVGRIQTIARYSNRLHIYNMDACEFLGDELPNIPMKSLVYLDPPYYSKGADLYDSYYGPSDHAYVADLITNRIPIRHKWIVSYDDVPQVRKLYAGFKRVRYLLSYSAARRQAGREVMFFARNMKMPSAKGAMHAW